MKKLMIATVAAAALAFPATANEITAYCEEYVTSQGGDPSGCACLGEAAAEDPTLAEALAAIDSPAALEAADASTKAAISACFPGA